jgi:hypothetical protein
MDEDNRRKFLRERNRRNIALAVVLGALAVLFFVMSIVQWHEHFGH